MRCSDNTKCYYVINIQLYIRYIVLWWIKYLITIGHDRHFSVTIMMYVVTSPSLSLLCVAVCCVGPILWGDGTAHTVWGGCVGQLGTHEGWWVLCILLFSSTLHYIASLLLILCIIHHSCWYFASYITPVDILHYMTLLILTFCSTWPLFLLVFCMWMVNSATFMRDGNSRLLPLPFLM